MARWAMSCALFSVRLTSTRRGHFSRAHCSAAAEPAPPPAPRIMTRRSRRSKEKDFADGADESGAIGVEADSARTVEEERVDRTELARGVVEFGADFQRLEFVGDGEVEAEEVGAAGGVHGFSEVFRRTFDLGIADIGAEGLKSCIVHGGREGVLDGRAEDGEADFGRNRAAAFGAGAEVVQGEGGLLKVGH